MSDEPRQIKQRHPPSAPKTFNEALLDLYNYGPDDMEIEYDMVAYSNEQFTQFTGRDMFIDFLELPGYKEEGIQTIHAIRIYLSHDTAKSLAEGIMKMVLNPQSPPVTEKK
jgi:hypothetical protein